MARKNRDDDETENQNETGEETGGEEKKRSSAFGLWFEEAWEGWLKSVGVILLCAVAYLLYKFDLINENLAGALLVAIILGGTLLSVVLPSWQVVQNKPPGQKALYATMVLMWIAASGYPALRASIRPAPLGEATVTTEGQTVKVKTNHNGPYEVTVSGHLKAGGAEAEAGYSLVATGGGGEDRVEDSLERKVVRVRVSRKGGTSSSVQESNERQHPLPNVKGGEITFTAERLEPDKLEDGLLLTVHSAGLNPIIFYVLGVLAFLIAIGFDARLTDLKGKLRTYNAVGVGICVVFAIFLPMLATPHSLVRPAVDALLRAVFIGGAAGWLLGSIARLLGGPKIKKAKR
jgi:hypothetical protein